MPRLTHQNLWALANDAQETWHLGVDRSHEAETPCELARFEAIAEVAYCHMVEFAEEAARAWFEELSHAQNNK